MTDADKPVEEMTVSELKKELGNEGLSTDGNKPQLQDRLRSVNDGEPGTNGIRGDEPQYISPG